MEEISIKSLSEKFESHLSVDGNKRIIFSGKFGTGKSFFLDRFFKERKEKYNTITINPVNYVVSSNEDIFELIKADIVNDLFFTGKIHYTEGQKSELFERLFLFSGEKPETVVAFVASLLSKFNPLFELTDSYLKAMKGLKESFVEYDNALTTQEKSRHEELAEFAQSLESKRGSIYEHNYITKVINTFLKEVRGGEKGKMNVLIIDDLDRIDPEHIFRILNILSVHNNHIHQDNKFEFDHIIIVCDLDNIEKIFYHKYGAGIDFDGYIDKFFSTEVFSITNDDALLIYIDNLEEVISLNDSEKKILVFILRILIQKKLITIRKLMKIFFPVPVKNFMVDELSEIDIRYYQVQNFGFIKPNTRLYVDSSDFSFSVVLTFFSRVFGSIKKFKEVLSVLAEHANNDQFDLIEKKDVCDYLALQKHISEKSGEDLFVMKHISYDSFREMSLINKIDWPEISFLGRKFKFQLRWTNGNPYKGDVSYFQNCKSVLIDHPSNTFKANGIVIFQRDFFKEILLIIDNCYSKKLIENFAD